jgi:molecular chaperone GrpE
MSGTSEKSSPGADIDAPEPAPEAPAPGDPGAAGVEVPVELTGEGAAEALEGAPTGDTPEAAEVGSLRAQLELSQKLARATMEKLREEHDRVLRAAADLENYRKRAAREKEELQRFAAERLVKDLLPAVDNLERALRAATEDDPLTGGVRMVLKLLEGALARHGAAGQSALGQPFDPRLHEALMRVETADAPPGTVVQEHGRAWTLGGRLLRPAMVAVAAAPPAEPEAAGGHGTEGTEPA